MDATPAPEWARGFPIDWLKTAAAIYRDEFKPNTYGAFGIPKERDVADARAAGQLVWTKELDTIAMFRQSSVGSTHQDFAGRQAKLHAGDLFIRSIAGPRGGKRRVIEVLLGKAKPPAAWVEAHVENFETVKLLTETGFEHVMTKISASSDLKGLYLFASQEEAKARVPGALDSADQPGVKVVRPAFLTPEDRQAVLAELEASGQAWAQHYSSYNKRSSWTSFALCGYDQDDPGFIIKPSEMSKDWKAKNGPRLIAACTPTIAARHFPAAMAIADRIPGKKQRVRLMRLSAGNGELTRHSDITDPEAGTRDGQIARLHIPIATHPTCQFRSWGLDGIERRLHFPLDALCYIDTRKPHAVINPSAIERIHLVIDTYSSPELRLWLAGS